MGLAGCFLTQSIDPTGKTWWFSKHGIDAGRRQWRGDSSSGKKRYLDKVGRRYDVFGMTILSVKLDDELEAKLVSRAAALGVTKSEVVRQAIAEMDDASPKHRDEALAEVRKLAQSLPAAGKFKESPVIALRRKKHLHARLR